MANEFDITQEELKYNLRGYVPVTFSYRKSNGEIRIATGTLNPSLIPEGKMPKDSGKNVGANLKYFDLGKESWRSLTQDCSLIKIIE
jgi:hypothetical protein